MKTIVTHGANFHPDDLFATATIMLMLKKTASSEKVKLIRTQVFNESAWKDADFVLDIGRIYAPAKNRFDHHQTGGAGARQNADGLPGIPYATFGLVWKKYGKKLSGSQSVADYVDRKLCTPIDAGDNGVSLYIQKFEKVSPLTIEDYIYMKCDEGKDVYQKTGKIGAFDPVFKKLLPLATDLVEGIIQKGKYKEVALKKATALVKKAKDKRVIVLDKYFGFDFSEFPEPLIVVYPDARTKGNWAAKTVRKSDAPGQFESRIYFPKAWAGKMGADLAKISGVSDAYFCHNSCFLAVATSKVGILQMVEKALAVL